MRPVCRIDLIQLVIGRIPVAQAGGVAAMGNRDSRSNEYFHTVT